MQSVRVVADTRPDDHSAILFFRRVPASTTDTARFFAQLLERIEQALEDADRAESVRRD